MPGTPVRSNSAVNRGEGIKNMIAALKAREAENSILRKRVVKLEAENRRLWDAMRATGELLRELAAEDD
jgi:hypothetical protein